MNKNVIIALVVVVLGGGIWWMMGGDSPQSVIDDAVALTKDCSTPESLADADKQKECAAGFEDLGKRMEELGKDMSDEDKAKWGKEMAKALLGEIPGA